MAENYIPPDDWLGNLKDSLKESKSVFKLGNDQRRDKDTIPKILSVSDIQKGKWDTDRILTTTLNGVKRAITTDDLKAFKKNIAIAKNTFTGGMTAQQIINHSLDIDRERAREQITMVVPISANRGVVRFMTNAGGETPNVHRHYVNVEFLHYEIEASSADTTARQAALNLRKKPLKIECDCGRQRFWHSYIASIGGFKFGVQETGFPRIRNPNLNGVACKHLLRVMQEIVSGGAFITFMTKQLEKGKAHDENKAQNKTTQKNAEKIVKNQSLRKNNDIIIKELKKAVKNAPKPNKTAKGTGGFKPNPNLPDPYALMKSQFKAMGLSDKQIDAMIEAAKNNA